MRKFRAFVACVLVAGLFAAAAASATTPHYYPRARVLCAQAGAAELHKILALSRNPAIAATAVGRATFPKVEALVSRDSRLAVAIFHRIRHSRQFRRSSAATREVCMATRAFKSDAHVLEYLVQIGREAIARSKAGAGVSKTPSQSNSPRGKRFSSHTLGR